MTTAFHEELLTSPPGGGGGAEEAVLNSMLTAHTVTGWQGNTVYALPAPGAWPADRAEPKLHQISGGRYAAQARRHLYQLHGSDPGGGGSAGGMGNIWLFPYRVGQYAGGAFRPPTSSALSSYGPAPGSLPRAAHRHRGLGPFDYVKTRGLRAAPRWGSFLLGVLGIAIGYSGGGWAGSSTTPWAPHRGGPGWGPDGYFSALAVSFGSVPWHLLVIAATVLILILGSGRRH